MKKFRSFHLNVL
uniref:Uncharacterized protein n=1 Tax=Arundo donax TaxID=35708 RepID=A0A0A8YNX7_ARUDO